MCGDFASVRVVDDGRYFGAAGTAVVCSKEVIGSFVAATGAVGGSGKGLVCLALGADTGCVTGRSVVEGSTSKGGGYVTVVGSIADLVTTLVVTVWSLEPSVTGVVGW